nr:glycosyltransferase family 39 protein [Roseibium sp. RKSG952]
MLKFWSASHANFVEDEAYYRLWGLYPALSYYDHPPMIGWWIWAGQQIFGDTVIGVRFLVVLSSALGSLFLWRTAYLLFDERTAGWAVLFLNTSILVGVGGILATPDAPSVFFWGLALWSLAELIHSRNAYWWLAVGLFAGLGLLSKYSVLFLGAGIVAWLLWVPQARRWLGCWQLWAGGAIAVLCTVPVIYWNSLYDWASFYKQFGRAEGDDWTLKYYPEFVGGLLGLLNPLIAILAVAGFWRLLPKLGAKDTRVSLLLLSVVPFLLYLTYHSAHARVQANWPAPLFPALAMLAAVFAAQASARVWQGVAKTGVVLGVVVAIVVQIHAVHALNGALGRKDPTSQLRGWHEIGFRLEQIVRDTGASYILTSGYGLNGQLDFLMHSHLPVYQFNERIRYVMMPEPDPARFRKTGLYVAEARRDRSKDLTAHYDHVVEIARLPRTVRGVKLEDLVVYELTGFKSDPIDPVVPRPGK